MMVYFGLTQIYVSLAILVIVLIVLRSKSKSFSYLLFFSIFWIYLMSVVSVVAFPFPVGISNPDFKPSINLIPFYFGRCEMINLCMRDIFDNILLTVPFGFGISFIFRFKPNNITWLAMTVGFSFEITQLIISFIFKSAFRSVDINDVILNATGVLVGYGIFRIFGLLYLLNTQRFGLKPKYIFAYIYNIIADHTLTADQNPQPDN